MPDLCAHVEMQDITFLVNRTDRFVQAQAGARAFDCECMRARSDCRRHQRSVARLRDRQ